MIYFFEDVVVGWKHAFGDHLVTRADVLDFASRFDPQPFHQNDEAASRALFGKVATSGWHSCSMAMRMMVDHWHSIPGWQEATLGTFGLDEVRFHKAVYPDDRLHCTWEIEEKRESRSRPELGIIKSRHEVFNQDDVKVVTFLSTVGHRRRPSLTGG